MTGDSCNILHLIHNNRVCNIGFTILNRTGYIIGYQTTQITGMFSQNSNLKIIDHRLINFIDTRRNRLHKSTTPYNTIDITDIDISLFQGL